VKFYVVEIFALALGIVLYGLAATSTFTLAQFKFSRLDPAILVSYSVGAGLLAAGLGYSSMTLVGGRLSLAVTRSACRLTGARQVIRVSAGGSGSSKNAIFQRAYFLYASLLVFAFSIGVAWDLYNADGPKAAFLRPLIHALNAFSRPANMSPVVFSLNLLPVLLVLLAIGGLVPSFALPYFRKFKITGVNSPPFPIGALWSTGGLVIGLSVVLALVGLIYNSLWANKGPIYYHFTFLVMLGFSIHFALGTFLARGRSERMIERSLRLGSGSNLVFLGSVELLPEERSEGGAKSTDDPARTETRH
jgi:hypothetical protein